MVRVVMAELGITSGEYCKRGRRGYLRFALSLSGRGSEIVFEIGNLLIESLRTHQGLISIRVRGPQSESACDALGVPLKQA